MSDFSTEFLSSTGGAGNFDQRVEAGIRYLLCLRHCFVSAMTGVSVHARLQSGVTANRVEKTKIRQL
jgi:hypothetical protein